MTDETKDRPKYLDCGHIAYAVHPKHQPIIKDNVYYCKYCGCEVETEFVLDGRIGWMHKVDGKSINLDEIE